MNAIPTENALGFDRLQSQRAVGGRSRKDDADGARTLIFRKRPHESVYWTMLTAPFLAGLQSQLAAFDRHASVTGHDVDAIGRDERPVLDLPHRKRSGS